ncbi:hypothetical protein VNO77_13895 [Canavalia gladiata]|uniref:Pectinesterase inhibitor domain-containing protein n=1 Tax=Canavalia gladiata TaxID=3824 RepID=A0AAN9LYB2_CANGL
MDLRFKENIIVILLVTLSSFPVFINAVPSTFTLQLSPAGAPSSVPESTDENVNLLGNLMSLTDPVPDKFNPEIVKFCAGTEDPTHCAETITPYLRDGFDPIRALETEINATMVKAKEIAAVIAKLLSDPNTSKKSLEALDICQSQYGDMMDTIKEALQLVAQQNVVDAYYKFSSVISDKSACDDAFKESPGASNPFAQNSEALFQLGGNCLSIMDGIVNNNKL